MRRPVPLERLAGEAGLDSREAATRRRRYGPNRIVEAPPGGWRDLARETARDPMLWFLLGTAALFALLRDWPEALTLLAALLPLAGMDAFLHRRTQASTAGLAGRLAATAQVWRNGHLHPLPAIDLVPGDRVEVTAGTPFPADGLLVRQERLQVDESTLTGEAYPVRKTLWSTAAAGPTGTIAVDDTHWGFAGTRVLTGTATLAVVYTGAETLYGEIVRSAQSGAHARTPLQAAIANLVTVLLVAAAVLCLGLAWVRLAQGFGLVDALLSAVTLAVAALPEEFPVVFTFFLGVGVYRLARRQALVRRAVAVENIGRISCICSDKTGTLTEGRLRLAHCFPAADISEAVLLTGAAHASRRESGDPLDTAILERVPTAAVETVATYPFTEDRRRETAIIRDAKGRLYAQVKGAPETVLGRCTMAEPERGHWQGEVQALAAAGHKVIAIADRELFPAWPGGEPERGFRFLGLLAFEDPLRPEATEAVRRCREAAIRVVMVTGDHPATARAVAAELGLGGGTPRVINAEQIGDDEPSALTGADVIARAEPARKLALVRALQREGEVVAVTGDGVNDVPALQAADIGIAMGERGTRSAREVAAVVLLDDNFRTIVCAVAEGRQLFRNLRFSFAYLLMIHIPLVVSAALIPLAGYPLLYLPIHIVWLELIIHPTALLVFQELPSGEELRPQSPRRHAQFFNWREWAVIAVVGTAITALVIGGYAQSLGTGRDIHHARAMALVTLNVASAAITAALSGLRTRAARTMVVVTLTVTLLLVQWPMAAALLQLSPLHPNDWLTAAFGGAVVALLPVLVWRRR